MKRILTILAATLLLTAAMAGTASASSYDSVAEELSAIGVFRGTAGGFELDRAPTRSEAAIMLVRLYGAEDEAKAAYEAGEISMPFTDVSETAAPSVAWLYSQGITNGTSATTFGASSPCSAKMYCAFLLRALGYEDGVDFLYADTLDFAMLHGLFNLSMLDAAPFLRDDLAAGQPGGERRHRRRGRPAHYRENRGLPGPDRRQPGLLHRHRRGLYHEYGDGHCR